MITNPLESFDFSLSYARLGGCSSLARTFSCPVSSSPPCLGSLDRAGDNTRKVGFSYREAPLSEAPAKYTPLDPTDRTTSRALLCDIFQGSFCVLGSKELDIREATHSDSERGLSFRSTFPTFLLILLPRETNVPRAVRHAHLPCPSIATDDPVSGTEVCCRSMPRSAEGPTPTDAGQSTRRRKFVKHPTTHP